MFCKHCGNSIPDGATQCAYCRQSVVDIVQPVQEIKSHLTEAILVTLFCCIPFGIVAIVHAARVSDLVAAGKIDEAMKASDKAKTWITVSIILGIIVGIFYFIIGFLEGFAG